jgi:hypothetical protein
MVSFIKTSATLEDKPRLSPPEWLAVATILLGIIILCLITQFNQPSIPEELLAKPEKTAIKEIEVTISGEIKNPGTYRLNKGSSFKDLLALAEPFPEANLSKFNLDKKLRNNQKIKIPKSKRKAD